MPVLSSSLAPAARGAHLLVPVAAAGLAETVAQQLADAVHVGLFAPGEQLPAETVLAAQLGVSTVTLRDALETLRRQGLVETRRGRHGGSFVVGPTVAPTDRMRARLHELSVVELRDLSDEWTAVAGAAARLAAARASEVEAVRLRTFADALAGAEQVTDRVRANGRFGIELALASQSERLTRAEVRLQAEAGELLWTPTTSSLDPVAVAADLHLIADAVAAEDEVAARDLAETRTQQNVRWLTRAHLELCARERGAERSMSTDVAGSVATAHVDRCVAELEVAIGTVFDGLRVMAAALAARWLADPHPLSAAAITSLQPSIFEQLDAQPVFDSAGYVMSETALAGARRHLEWWHRGPDRTFQPLILDVEPGGPDCYDYYAMEWFFAGIAERRRFVSGPLIDLPCADVCIMTFTEPVIVGPGPADGTGSGDVLGVAGADVALSRFESLILPPLRRVAAPAVLVNRQRRVITSNDARWISGEKLPSAPRRGGDEWQAVEPVTGDLGWVLAVQR